jgi:hypothetical protein
VLAADLGSDKELQKDAWNNTLDAQQIGSFERGSDNMYVTTYYNQKRWNCKIILKYW